MRKETRILIVSYKQKVGMSHSLKMAIRPFILVNIALCETAEHFILRGEIILWLVTPKFNG